MTVEKRQKSREIFSYFLSTFKNEKIVNISYSKLGDVIA